MENITEQVVEHVKNTLDLRKKQLGEEFYYNSLPLCVIDAVFSIGVKYTSTKNTVIRFCEHFDLKMIRNKSLPEKSEQISISDFLNIYDKYGSEYLSENVYKNRQRTSSRNGILKSEAVFNYSQILKKYDVDIFQDVHKIIGNSEFENEVFSIPGQKSGISTRYFYMLVGDDNYIKPDRMVTRFIKDATNHTFGVEESHNVITGAYKQLVKEYEHLTPRLLDYMIWDYQRNQG